MKVSINFWSPESRQVFLKDVCDRFDVEAGLIGSENFAIVRAYMMEEKPVAGRMKADYA